MQIEEVAEANDNFEKAFQNLPVIDNIGMIEKRAGDNVNENRNDDDNLEESETFGTNTTSWIS